MAQTHYHYKNGSTFVEVINGVEVGTTGGTNITHKMGVIPTSVVITPTSQYWVAETIASRAATSLVLTSENASATCSLKLEWAQTADSV